MNNFSGSVNSCICLQKDLVEKHAYNLLKIPLYDFRLNEIT